MFEQSNKDEMRRTTYMSTYSFCDFSDFFVLATYFIQILGSWNRTSSLAGDYSPTVREALSPIPENK